MTLPCQKRAYSAYYNRHKAEICERNRLASQARRDAEREFLSRNPEARDLVREKWRDKYRSGLAKKIQRKIGDWLTQDIPPATKTLLQTLLTSEQYKEMTLKGLDSLVASQPPQNLPTTL